MNENFNKNAKVEKLTKKMGKGVRLIVIGPFKSNSKHSLIYISLLDYQTHKLTIEMCAKHAEVPMI